jgi:serine phosphatase RsbU (regulator of sigma subunit)
MTSQDHATIDPIEVVHRLSCAIAQAADLQQVYQILLDEVVDMLGVDKASIMVYDAERKGLRVAAARGMDRRVMEGAFVSVGEGISGRVFESDEPLLVEDIRSSGVEGSGDDRYRTSSLMSAPVTCFPMRMGSSPLGVINVTDRRDGSAFDDTDLKVLTTAANQVAAYMHVCQLADEVRSGERLRNELEIAKNIQQRLLPSKPLEVEGLDVAGSVLAAEKVGGDYYDYFITHSRRPSFVIADVSGHNITAAMIIAALRSVIRAQRDADYSPSALVQKVNTILFDDLSSTEQFISMMYFQYLGSRQIIRYTNAGHPPSLVWRANLGEFEELFTEDPLLGIDPLSVYHEKNLVVSSGDVIVLYTDGITEAANAEGDRFGADRMKEIIRDHASSGARGVVDALFDRVAEFVRPKEIKDDISILVCKVV